MIKPISSKAEETASVADCALQGAFQDHRKALACKPNQARGGASKKEPREMCFVRGALEATRMPLMRVSSSGADRMRRTKRLRRSSRSSRKGPAVPSKGKVPLPDSSSAPFLDPWVREACAYGSFSVELRRQTGGTLNSARLSEKPQECEVKLCVMIAHGIVGFRDCRTCDGSINPPLPICKDLSARCTVSLKHINK